MRPLDRAAPAPTISAPDMSKLYRDRPEPYQAAKLRIRGGPATRPRPSGGHRIRVAGIDEYTLADWEAESFAIFGEGGDPGACPDCGRTGFYGPRFADPDRRYRACRFCGFWQDVDGDAERYIPTAHSCELWPEVSKSAYIWWVAPGTDAFDCPFCQEPLIVDASTVPIPSDTPKHPWWHIPQGRPQSFYQRLWRNWEWSTGRTIL